MAVQTKWTAASYKEERFLQNNAKWLTGTIKLSAWVKQRLVGRGPQRVWELSDRSKRRKTKELGRRSSADKKIVNENKIRIQQQFKEEMSLLVDVPKAGFGNTNTGNVSRRFFCDPETASRITGVDLDLIKRLRTLLEVISSGHRIDTDKLSTFCKETSEIYVRLYGWYPMTPTLHKLLVHGPTIIKHAIIPIGQLSEEAAEARNKHFRQYRTDFARKFSKISCNVDVLNRLLLSSDPLLSCTRSRFMKNKKPFTKEALEFLIPERLTHRRVGGLAVRLTKRIQYSRAIKAAPKELDKRPPVALATARTDQRSGIQGRPFVLKVKIRVNFDTLHVPRKSCKLIYGRGTD
ncbi:hypothetical protein EVAR_17110_1 [Eumeta japonica]|uniref:Uncharacterized protein n=1 Tax=Eumeta variegata TaxID=151549 RepID=A0A4C1UMK9_EUMVA|nr:hypothetical protein EVAR_17110_1 [Eumeta japonica]